jgi:hypothetical protein
MSTESALEYTPFGWVDYNEYLPELKAASEKIKQAVSARRLMISENAFVQRRLRHAPSHLRHVTAYGGGPNGLANHVGVTKFKIDVNADANKLDINGRTALHVAAKMYYETFSYDPKTLREGETVLNDMLVAVRRDISYYSGYYGADVDEDKLRELEGERDEIERAMQGRRELYLPDALKDMRKKIQLLCKTLVEVGADWKVQDGHGKYAHDYNPSILYYVFLHDGINSLDQDLKFGFECETIGMKTRNICSKT